MVTCGIDEMYENLFARITFEMDYCGPIVGAGNRHSAVARGHIDRLTEIEGYLLSRRMRAVRAAGG